MGSAAHVRTQNVEGHNDDYPHHHNYYSLFKLLVADFHAELIPQKGKKANAFT
jgi:hypothetical protein